MNNGTMELSSVLDFLKNADKKYSNEKICEISVTQKKEYKDKLEKCIMYNEMHAKDKDAPKDLDKKKGDSLEELASYLLQISGGLFTIDRNVRTATNEIDQIFKLTTKGNILLSANIIDRRYKLFLGECKNYKTSVSVTYIGKFCSLLLTNNIKLGILFSYHGISGSGWSYGAGLIKKFYLHKEKEEERFCIIDFSIEDFKKIEEGHNFLEIVESKINALRLDTDYERFLDTHPAQDLLKASQKSC